VYCLRDAHARDVARHLYCLQLYQNQINQPALLCQQQEEAMSTSAQMDQVVATVMSIVQAEYERFQKFPAVNLHAPLFYNFCSDICWKIKKALRRLGIDSEVVRGLWVGPVSDHYRATFDSDPATDKKRR
jgi:hypothetical protein